MTQPPEAWYADPSDPTRLRWWDGRQWTGHTAPMQPAYVHSHTRAATYRSARGLAAASIVLALLIVVVEVVLTALSLPSYNQINDAVSEGLDGTDVFTRYDGVVMLELPLEVAAYIVTCVWLWRVRANAEALNAASPHVRSRGWVWGGWICPVVSWWFPYQVVRDVARATARGDRRIGSWWGWFVAWTLLGNLIVRFAADGSFPVLQGVTTLVAIIAGARWVRIVRGIERDQQAHAAGRGV